MDSGVYFIRNKTNNKLYIGSTINSYFRFNNHISSLSRGIHHSFILQRAWDKYGEDNFEFKLVVKCPEEYLLKLEQWFIDNLKPKYNLSKTAGRAVLHHSEESKLKMRNTKLGKPNLLSRGDLHGRSKLTWQSVEEIRSKYQMGAKQHTLSEEYRVGQDTISRIVNNKAWQIVI